MAFESDKKRHAFGQVAATLEKRIADAAKELGFDICRITDAQISQGKGDNLRSYIDKGYHGSMDWMRETITRRANPTSLWPQANSVIVLAMNYGPQASPLESGDNQHTGQISVYARNRDYHQIIKGKLKTLAGKLVSWDDCDVKVFVDTAPVMEKPLAAKAGIGWQGKHTNLVSREFGAWLFLGSIFTTATLKPDNTEADHCGNCRSCLDICPTNAFPAPYQIDARRCISYLTIENKGPIPFEFRESIGNRIYGCDDCLAVCPWNKFAREASDLKLQPRDDLFEPGLDFLAGLNDGGFRSFFSGSPVKRIGRDRFLRNVLIAIGNTGNARYAALLEQHLRDINPIVRGAAIWALRMVAGRKQVQSLRLKYLPNEREPQVRLEWETELHETE